MQIAQKNFYKKFLGRAGEVKAVDFLKKKGFKILKTNYKTALGEIDIIAEDDGVVVFIEVKTRTDDSFGVPSEAVNYKKQQKYILSVNELGPHYEIILEREGYLDKLTVKVELAHSTDSFSELEKIKKEVQGKLKIILGLDAKVMLESPNTLQRFEGKAKRVKDLRGIK